MSGDGGSRGWRSRLLLGAMTLGRNSIKHERGSHWRVPRNLRLTEWLLLSLIIRKRHGRNRRLGLCRRCVTRRLHTSVLVAVIALGRDSMGHLRITESLCLALLLLLGEEFVEPGVLEGLGGADAELRSQLQHLLQEVDPDRVDHGQDLAEVLRRVHLEGGLVVGELGDARPGPLGRRAHYTENAGDLVFVGGAGKQGPAGVHLRHDATCRPDVDACIVCSAAQQDVGRAIPKSNHLVRESVDGNAECPCQSKVPELQLPLGVDQEVLGLEVSVQHLVSVAELDALEQLQHERLDDHGLQRPPIALGIHVFFEIHVHVVEHQHEFVLSVDDIV